MATMTSAVPGSGQAIEDSDLLEGLDMTLLTIYGIWKAINSVRKTGRKSVAYVFTTWCALIIVFPYVLCQLLSQFFIRMNLETIIFIYLNGVPGIQVITKMLVVWHNFPKLCRLFDLVRMDFLSCVPPHKQTVAKVIFRSIARNCNICCIVAFTIHIILIATWTTLPGVDPGNGRKKIMGGWYPVPYSLSPWYEVIYAYEALLFTWHGSLLAVYECILIQLLMGLYAQFKVLGHHITTLKKEDIVYRKGSLSANKDEGDTFLCEELEAIMRDFEKLHSYGAQLKEVYTFLTTVILGSGIAVMVITNLHLIFTETDPLPTFKFVLYSSYCAVEITLICLASSLVESASTDIQFCLYSSEWYLAHSKYKGALKMIMVRASKPLGLVVLKIYRVNLEIVIGIFQFIYTTSTVLSKMK